MDRRYVMRRMRREELDIAVGWAAAEGWNPGIQDADAFWETDPDGFFVGELEGEVISSISIVRYTDEQAFLGFYIVRPDHRGRGYGMRLWEFARGEVDANGTGLDGVVAQIESYRRSGFRLAHRNIRYVTTVRPSSTARSPMVRPLEPDDLEQLFAYDRHVFGHPRVAFLERWLAQPRSSTLVVVEEGRLRGYAMLRPAADGERVGPLFADSPEVAGALLDALIASARPESRVSLDVPGDNPSAIELVLQRSMAPEFETVRMYAGEPQRIRSEHVFGITSFELG